MKDEKLKFRWERIHAGWWACPKYKFSVFRNEKTGRWCSLDAPEESYENAEEATTAREARFIVRSQLLQQKETAETLKQAFDAMNKVIADEDKSVSSLDQLDTELYELKARVDAELYELKARADDEKNNET